MALVAHLVPRPSDPQEKKEIMLVAAIPILKLGVRDVYILIMGIPIMIIITTIYLLHMWPQIV